MELIVNVEPGPRVYVRNINFSGNVTTKRTKCCVARCARWRAHLALPTTSKQSRPVFNRLGFFETAEVDTKAGAGQR